MNNVSVKTVMIKKLNIELVKSALLESECATKLTIANATGLSVATCGNILNELLERGEVFEIDEQSNGGRPARRFVFNADYGNVLCMILRVEHGVTSLTYSVVNLVGKVLENDTLQMELNFDSIDAQVERLIGKYQIIKAIGIGVPGVVIRGKAILACDIESLENLALGEKLAAKYGVEVVVENDMNLQAVGFIKQQSEDEEPNLAVIYFPSDNCMGSGIIVNGYVLNGYTHFAGEVSFLPFDMTREEQMRQLADPDTRLPLMVKTITSMIAIINPETIVLTGDLIREEMEKEIFKSCVQIVPEEHMPRMIIREDIMEDYMHGLITVTVDSLSYDIALVKKRR